MGIYDFNILSIEDKAKLIWDKGTFLSNRKENDFGVNLYAFSYFYVEVWVSNDPIRIEDVKSFMSSDLLEPYLKSIILDFNN